LLGSAVLAAALVRLFSDCIAEFSAAFQRLDVYRAVPPELNDAKVRDEILAQGTATAAASARCDSATATC
jgi:hypothetical protein